ncbi:MAG: response regulator [Verrucomicrobiota bacterium]
MTKSEITRRFGTSVKGWRNQLGISQEELAERADLHRTYVCDVECGARNVTLATIERLARALGTTVATLCSTSESFRGGVTFSGTSSQSQKLVEILLVEDNPDDVEMTLHAFKSARFTNHVQVVSDGEEALNYVFCQGKYALRSPRNNPQIILLDLNLPKVNGKKVLARIKANEKTRNIPVVMLTMSENESEILDCVQLGAAIYITKPVNFQGLCQVIPRLNFEWALLEA